MSKSVIAEGKTTNEAIANALNQLNVSKDKVDIKVLENEEKRSFFSILAPRVVKVEVTLKDGVQQDNSKEEKTVRSIEKVKRELSKEDIELAKANVDVFLKDFAKNFEGINYKLDYDNEFLKVEIQGESSSKLIGYRGEVLNSLQAIINSIANKNCMSRVKVILDIGGYKEKREKALEELADKLSKTVLKTGKSVALEPMMAYERKVIHNRLQRNDRVKTYSVGEEPYRKVVIVKK